MSSNMLRPRNLSGSRSDHCYSRAELKAIKKFNSLFKKIVVLPSNKTFTGINSQTTKTKYTKKPKEELNQPSFSFTSETCNDLGHNSKEIQMAGEDEFCTRKKNDYCLQETMLFEQLSKKLLTDHILENSVFLSITSEQNPRGYEIEEIQQLFYSFMKQYDEEAISDRRICTMTYPIYYTKKKSEKQRNTSEHEENPKHKKKKNSKSSSLNESNDDINGQYSKFYVDCKKNHEIKNGNFRLLTIRDKVDTLIPVNKNFLEMLSPNFHDETYSKKRYVSYISHKKDINVQTNPESSTSLMMYGCDNESPADVKIAIDRVIRYLKDIEDARNNFGCNLIESIRNTCVEILANCKNYCEDEKKMTIVLNRNGFVPLLEDACTKTMKNAEDHVEYEKEREREKRIQALIEKIKDKTRCLCAKTCQQSKNEEKTDRKLEKTAHSQDIISSDEKMSKEKSCRKIEKTSHIDGIEQKREELLGPNIKIKCCCRHPDELITGRCYAIDEIKKREREKKLEELVRIIMMKRKCVCREDLADQLHGGLRNLVDDIQEKLSITSTELSDISLEAISHRYSDGSVSKRVSYFNEVSQTEPTSKHRATNKNEMDTKKPDKEATTVLIKLASSNQSFDGQEKYDTEETSQLRTMNEVNMVSEETSTHSIYKNDASITTDQENEMQVDTLNTEKMKNGNDRLLDVPSDVEKNENADYTEGERPSSEEEFYDTSEERIGKFEGSFEIPRRNIPWEEDEEYADEAREEEQDEEFTKLQGKDEETPLREKDSADSNKGNLGTLSRPETTQKVETEKIENENQYVDSETYENDDEMTTKFANGTRRDTFSEGVDEKRKETEDMNDNTSTSKTKKSDTDAKKIVLQESVEKVLDGETSSKIEKDHNVNSLPSDLYISQDKEKKIIQQKKNYNIYKKRKKNVKQFDDSSEDKKLFNDTAVSQKQNDKFNSKDIADELRRKNGKSSYKASKQKNPDKIADISQNRLRKLADQTRKKSMNMEKSFIDYPSPRQDKIGNESQKNVDEKLDKYTDTENGKGFREKTTQRKKTGSQEFKGSISKSESDLRKTFETISGNKSYNHKEKEMKDKSKGQSEEQWKEEQKHFMLKDATGQNLSDKKKLLRKQNSQKAAEFKSQSEKRNAPEKHRKDNKDTESKMKSEYKTIIERNNIMKIQGVKDLKDDKENFKNNERERAIESMTPCKCLNNMQIRVSDKRQTQVEEKCCDDKIRQNLSINQQLEKLRFETFDKNDRQLFQRAKRVLDAIENDEASISGAHPFIYAKQDGCLGKSEFSDTFLDESLKFPKKTSVLKSIDNPTLVQTDDEIILKETSGARFSKYTFDDIKKRMKIDNKMISCETLDSLFGLGYLIQGRKTQYNDEKLTMSKKNEEQNSRHYSPTTNIAAKQSLRKNEEEITSQNIYNEPATELRTSEKSSRNGIKPIKGKLRSHKHINYKIKTESSSLRIDSKNEKLPKEKYKSASSEPTTHLPSIEENIETQENLTTEGKNTYQRNSQDKGEEIVERPKVNPIKSNKYTSDVITNQQKLENVPSVGEKLDVGNKYKPLTTMKFISKPPNKQKVSKEEQRILEEAKTWRNKKTKAHKMSENSDYANAIRNYGLNDKTTERNQAEKVKNKNKISIFSRYWDRSKARNEQADTNFRNGKKTEKNEEGILEKKNGLLGNEKSIFGNGKRLSFHDDIHTNIEFNESTTQSGAKNVATDQSLEGRKLKRSKHIESIAERIVDDVIRDSYKVYEKRLQQIGQITKENLTKQHTGRDVPIQKENKNEGLTKRLIIDPLISETEKQNSEDAELTGFTVTSLKRIMNPKKLKHLGTKKNNKVQKNHYTPKGKTSIKVTKTDKEIESPSEVVESTSFKVASDALKDDEKVIHEISNLNEHETNQKEAKIFSKPKTRIIYSNEDIRMKDMLEKIGTDINKDLESIRGTRVSCENSDSKFNLDDDGIDISKFATYSDIIEDISLDKAMEMKKISTGLPPFLKKNSTLNSNENTGDKSLRYKLCEIEEAWSSSSLKTTITSSKSRKEFYKCKNLYDYPISSDLMKFTHQRQDSGRKLLVANKKSKDIDLETRQIMSKTKNAIFLGNKEKKITSKTCFCNDIELRKLKSIQNICSCPGYTSFPINETEELRTDNDSGLSQQFDTTFKISSIKNNNLETAMNKFKRKYFEQGKRITVPSTSSGYMKGRNKITENVPIYEPLSNVRGSTIGLTEFDTSPRFFSACNILPNENGCLISEEPKEKRNGESVEKYTEVNSSRAIENLSQKIFGRNEFEKYDFRNLFSSLPIDEENLSEGKLIDSKNSEDKNKFKGYDETFSFKRRCISEKCVRFQRCEDVHRNRTNSLNLDKNYSPCLSEKDRYFCKQNINIYNCFGINKFPEYNMSISIPPGSVRSDSKDDHERNKMSRSVLPSSRCNDSLQNHSKIKKNLSFSSFIFGIDNKPSIHNFNTRLIKVLAESKTSRFSKMNIQRVYKKYRTNESLMNLQNRPCGRVLNINENIVSCISLKPLKIENDYLIKSIFSMNISRSFTFDNKSFNTLLNILTESEQKILMSRNSTELNQTFSQEHQFDDGKMDVIQNVTNSSESEIKEGKETYMSFEEKKDQFSKSKNSKLSKKGGEKRRKLFDHYEKQRAIKWRKTSKFNSCIKGRNQLNETLSIGGILSSDSENIFSLQKSPSFYSGDFSSSVNIVSDGCEEIRSKDSEIQETISINPNNRKPFLSQTNKCIAPIKAFNDMSTEEYLRNITRNTTPTCIDTNDKDTYHPYGQDTTLYPASVDFDEDGANTATSDNEHKQKFSCKEIVMKMVNWVKSLGINPKHEETFEKKSNEALWKAEVNLLKQRKVLRSKLRYPKTKTSKLYLHKRDYDQIQEETEEISKAHMIEPVLMKISSREIIEPEYEDEEASSSETEEVEEETPKTRKDKRLLVFSEDSMVLFDRKKVYDRLQMCGKLYYTIYLNGTDDWDHVSIRSAESVERRVECKDRPFFATYDLGPNDVRVHVTKDTFEEKKREPIFKNENYVECQNSKVKLSLMRGKRYFTDLDPTKAKIIEIDCTNQFSEIKICYKKTDLSKECICEYPQVCKAVQLESSELSSVDIDREDKSQDTQELDKLQNSKEMEGLKTENMFQKGSEDVNTVEFCSIQQGFKFLGRDSDEESEKDESSGNKYPFSVKSSRHDVSNHLRRRCKKLKKKMKFYNKHNW